MELEEFIDRITELTPRLCRAMLAQETNCFSCDRVTLQEIWALEIVAQQEPCPRSVLVERLRLKSSTGTILLNRMERNGLIRRERTKENRRVVYLALTPRGRRIMNQARERRKAALRLLLSPLQAAERGRYVRMLEDLTSQFST